MRFFRIAILVVFFASVTVNGFCNDSLVVTDDGNVGIGTSTPATTLEVDGDLTVNGNIKKGGTYADWFVGNYYSIPTDQRSGGWNWSTGELTGTWSTVDLSSVLPVGVKRVKIYVDVVGKSNNNGKLLLRLRPFGAISNKGPQCNKVLLQAGPSNTDFSRVAVEIEVDVSDGKFQITEYPPWDIGTCYINLRGFYM